MKAKFTKGPWKLYGDWGIQPESAKGDEKIFAQFSHDAECENTEEGFANANLIVVAPEMLEALQLARKCVGNQMINLSGDGNDFVSIKKIIDEVISKALGFK
ncbi:hypothetical protein [Pseudoalteromonas phage H103]|uniref:hypothetical protein n=1 Tax=Pseudoalteromonas phage H103 TaxID=1636200 RepID=UPI0006BC8323|nr:hypothetical protein AVU31_gp74 [Pseudoalteromonas phage H103]AKA61250.1 hypothetical protein [Pseudoalteromonas phage H103]